MKTKTPFSRFYALLQLMPSADKDELIWQYSNMLTTSLKEFSTNNPQAYEQMIRDMEKMCGNNESEVKRLRSAVLHRVQQCGVDTTKWANVNNFMKLPQIAGKMLFEMSNEELRAIIPKLESIINKKTIEKQKYERLKMCN